MYGSLDFVIGIFFTGIFSTGIATAQSYGSLNADVMIFTKIKVG